MFQHEREFSGATACHEFTSNVSKPWPVTSLKICFGKINCAKRTVQKHGTVVCAYLMLRRHEAYYSFIMMEVIYACYHRHVLHKPPN